MRSYNLLILLTSIWIQPLLAKDNSNSTPDEILLIVGTHIPNAKSSNLANKITITAKEIEALAANHFSDLLRGLPGIDVFQQGGAGGLTFLSLRGGDPNFVVILIDGVKVNDPTNSRGGAFDLGTIDPSIVEQVEISFGSFSSLYGSDGLSGIISIQTKGAISNQSTAASIKLGSNDVYAIDFHLAKQLDQFAELRMSGSIQDGDDSSFGEAFKRKQVSTSIQSVNNKNGRWSIGAFYANTQAESFPEDSGGDRLAIIRSPETRDFTQNNLSGRFQIDLTSLVDITFNSALSKREETSSNPGIAEGVLDSVPAIDSSTNYQRLEFDLISNYYFSDQFKLAVGIGHSNEKADMDSVIDFGFPLSAVYKIDRKTESVYAETNFDPLQDFHLSAGIRYDKTEAFSVTSQRFLSRYALDPSNSLSVQYSEGFKHPSFFALAHPLVGNPNLKPETSENFELSFEHYSNDSAVVSGANIYQNIYSDLVDFDPIAFTNINRSRVRARGVEVYLNYILSQKLNFRSQISYNKIKVFKSDAVLRRRPKLKASLLVNYQPTEDFSLTFRLTGNDDYFDSSVATGMVEMQGFNRFDFSAVWRLDEKIRLRLNISNLLNVAFFENDKEESVGFRPTGQNITFRVSKSF